MSESTTIFRYQILKDGLEEMGYTIKSSSTCFQISLRGIALCNPETIDGAYAAYSCLQVLKDKNLLK